MKNKYEKLFEPYQIGKVKIKNRIFMAPMGLVGFSDVNGGFSKECQDYYVERAKGGTGLLITGMCNVNYDEMPPQGVPCPTYNPIMFKSSTKDMVDRVHSYDSKIFLQLTGGLGRSAIPGATHSLIAPSESKNRFDPRVTHRAMTTEEVKKLIADFVQSAVIAKQCGFDGVEIHAVHEGYLLDQFAMSFFNQRTDEYGGSLENRLRMATEIVQGIKASCGNDFPVSIRYSLKSYIKGYAQGALPGETFEEKGRDIEEGIKAAKILADVGYDCLDADVGAYDSWYWNHPPMYFDKKGIYLECGRILKKEIDIPILLAGRMDDPRLACDSIGNECDMVGFARPLLADPYLPVKWETGNEEEVRPCLGCHDGCMGRCAAFVHLSCAVNPQCGFEKTRTLTPAMEKKKILIVGAGPGGMEAAMICAKRGHSVILADTGDRLGGTMNIAGIPSFKSNDLELIKWYERELNNLPVEIRLHTMVTAEYVMAVNVDAVITATGAKPIQLKLEGNGETVTAEEALTGVKAVGQKVLVIGGGLVGSEVALWMAMQGKQVSIAEMLPFILGGPHGDIPFMNKAMLQDLLKLYKVNINVGTKVLAVDYDSATLQKGESCEKMAVDTVIMAAGYQSSDELYNSLRSCEKPVYNIGDSRKFHNVMQAVWDGFEIASEI